MFCTIYTVKVSKKVSRFYFNTITSLHIKIIFYFVLYRLKLIKNDDKIIFNVL